MNAPNDQHKNARSDAPGDALRAFTQLVREHQAGLRAFVRALGVETDWVDDLTQEVFLIAYRKQAQFESGKEFGRWLRGIDPASRGK